MFRCMRNPRENHCGLIVASILLAVLGGQVVSPAEIPPPSPFFERTFAPLVRVAETESAMCSATSFAVPRPNSSPPPPPTIASFHVDASTEFLCGMAPEVSDLDLARSLRFWVGIGLWRVDDRPEEGDSPMVPWETCPEHSFSCTATAPADGDLLYKFRGAVTVETLTGYFVMDEERCERLAGTAAQPTRVRCLTNGGMIAAS